MTNPFTLGGFELDLGTLEKSSALNITDRKRTASIVNSQDEGPTDFTFNMGQWMKGSDAHNKIDTHQVQVADTQAEEQALKQPLSANNTTHNNINRDEQHSPSCFSHISGFTDGSDGPICSSTISPVRRPKVEKKPIEQPAPAQNTAYNTSGRGFSHVSGFTDGTDGPICSSNFMYIREPNFEKKPIEQSEPANDTTYNTVRHNEPHSSFTDRLPHISSIADGSDGPLCSSPFGLVRERSVNEDMDDSGYTLPPPEYPDPSGESLPPAPNAPKPTLRRCSG